jgi:predicted AAA+ superfamily ATPase
VARNSYAESFVPLSFWRLASGIEVDFVVGDMEVALEVKARERIVSDDLKGLRALVLDHPRVKRRAVVCLEPRRRVTQDGIEILPVKAFLDELAGGRLIP